MAYYGKGTKEGIMNYLGTAMNGITGIKFVDYQKVYDAGIKIEKCPGVYLNDVRVDKTKILKDIIKDIFTVGLVGYVHAKQNEKLSTVLNTFMELVKDKIIVDPTYYNYNIYDSRILVIETDAGSRHPQGMFVMMVEVIFFSSE